MKKILIFAYILAVLILSGMVKADTQDQAFVKNAEITPSGILIVQGYLSNACHRNPKIMVQGVDEAHKTLGVTIQSQVTDALCSGTPAKHYKMIFDLKTLPLKTGSDYNLNLENYPSKTPLTYKSVSGDYNVDDYNADKKDFVGVLSPSGTEGFILENKGEVIPVISPSMADEISKFQGEVHITGYAINVGALNLANDLLALSSQNQALGQIIVPVSLSQ
jgi:hypothetical protein